MSSKKSKSKSMSKSKSNSPTTTDNVSMDIEEKEEKEKIPVPDTITIPFILLTNLHNIVVAAGDRGAFKTAEMYDVGRVYKELQYHLTLHLRTDNENSQINLSNLPDPELETPDDDEEAE